MGRQILNKANTEYLTKKSFKFLLDDFGFKYNNNKFTSEKIEITITCDRDKPTVEIRPLSEPEFTNIQIDWIIDYFTNSEFTKTFDLQFGELEENIKTFAAVFKKYSKKLLFEIEDWWVPAHKYRLRKWETVYRKAPLEAFKKIYEYLDTKEK